MKKLLPVFLMALFASVSAFAAEVVVDFAALYGNAKVQPATELSTGGLTISFAKGNAGTEPAYFVNDAGTTKEMRLYGGSATATDGNTMTITSTSNITGITIDGASASKPTTIAELSASTGTIELGADRNATWSGSASSVTITVVRPSSGAGQYRFTKMTVTTGGSGEITVAKPTFSVAAGTYYAPISLELKCATAGASIHYTLDGSAPSASSTQYSGAIAISSTTTVKAIAVLGDKVSDVAEAAYVFESATPVANIAAYKGVADGTMVVFQNPVTVLKQYNKNMYVQDETGNALIFGNTGQTYSLGSVIPAGFVGEKTTYNGEPELSVYETGGFQAATSTVKVEPELIQVADINAENFAKFVMIKGVKLGYTTTASGAKNLATITDASGEGAAYNSLGYTAADLDYENTVDMYGIIGAYKAKDATEVTYQFLPVKYTAGGDDPEPQPGDGITIAEFNALEDNAAATFNALTVLAQSGQRMFVKDATGYMLVYGNVGQEYARGNVIPAGASGTKTTWDGEPELKDPANFKASTSTVSVTPEPLTAATLSHDLFGHLVKLEAATFSGSNIKSAAGVEYAYFNNMGATIPGDDAQYDVIAIVGSHGKAPNTVYQLLPVEVTKTGGGEVVVPKVADINALYAKDKNLVCEIESDLVAIFQSGNYLYVKNGNTYALVFGKLNETFVNGDVISGAQASWTEYNQAKQLSPVADTFVKSGTTDPVQPEEIPFEEVGTDMAHTYMLVPEATLSTADGKTMINDGTAEIQLYDQFFKSETIIPTEVEGKTFAVKGFIVNFKGTLEMYPIEIKDNAAPSIPEDVDGNGDVNVGDVNIVLGIIINEGYDSAADVNGDGAVNVGDVNQILAYILAHA